jgi:hypothetical protein
VVFFFDGAFFAGFFVVFFVVFLVVISTHSPALTGRGSKEVGSLHTSSRRLLKSLRGAQP